MFGIVDKMYDDPTERNKKIFHAAMLRPCLKIVHRYVKRNFDDVFNAGFIGVLRATEHLLSQPRKTPSHAVNYVRMIIKRSVIDYLNRDHLIRVPREALGKVRIIVGGLTGEEAGKEAGKEAGDLELTETERAMFELIVEGKRRAEIVELLGVPERKVRRFVRKLKEHFEC